jgi:hypothetical protein
VDLAEQAELVVKLSLKDQISRGVAGIKTNLKGLESSFGRIGGIAQKGVSTAITNIGRLGVVAAGAVATQVFAGIRSLEQLERVNQQTDAVIKSTAGVAGQSLETVRSLAQALEDVTTVDDKTVQSGENMLLTFTKIGKDVFPDATKAAVDMAVALADGDATAADVQGSALLLGKALNDPIRGLTALRRVGVQFTDQQEAQIKAMVKAGDTAGAQKIILQELTTEFGNAGEAAGKGAGGDIRRFQDAVENAQQALAVGFLPVIQEVTRFLKEKLSDPKVLAAIKDLGTNGAGLLKDAFEGAKKIPWAQVGDAFKLMGQGAKAAFDIFNSAPEWLKTAILTGWGVNKLTGGAVSGIIGELGKGLIKGVLGMNAGMVNVKAASVTVAGGGGIPGGRAGAAGGAAAAVGGSRIMGALTVAGSLLIAGVAIEQVFEEWGRLQATTQQAHADLESKIATIPDKTYSEAYKAVSDLTSTLHTQEGDLIGSILEKTGTGSSETVDAFKALAANLTQSAQTPEERQAATLALQKLYTQIQASFGAGAGQADLGAQLDKSLATAVAELKNPGATTLAPGTITALTTPLMSSLEAQARAEAAIRDVGAGIESGWGSTRDAVVAALDHNNNGVVSMKEVIAAKLGVSITELSALKQESGGWNATLAGRLGISNDRLQAIKASAASTVTTIKNKNWSPTIVNKITIPVRATISGREVYQAITHLQLVSGGKTVE